MAKRLGVTTDAPKVIKSLMRCLAADLAASLGVNVSRIKVVHKPDPAAPPKDEAEGFGLFAGCCSGLRARAQTLPPCCAACAAAILSQARHWQPCTCQTTRCCGSILTQSSC